MIVVVVVIIITVIHIVNTKEAIIRITSTYGLIPFTLFGRIPHQSIVSIVTEVVEVWCGFDHGDLCGSLLLAGGTRSFVAVVVVDSDNTEKSPQCIGMLLERETKQTISICIDR